MSTRTLRSSRLVSDAIWEHLKTIAAINHFRGGVVENDVTYDDDQKVHGYAVLWAGGGEGRLGRLSSTPETRGITFQITCVGGDDNRALWVYDKVIDTFDGLRLVFSEGRTTPITQDGDPGPVQMDRDLSPPRYQIPVVFVCRLDR